MYVIQGQIGQTDEKPAVGLMVRAFNKDAGGSETKLGESVSDQDGLYKITYPEALFSKLSGGRNVLDMILRVFDPPGHPDFVIGKMAGDVAPAGHVIQRRTDEPPRRCIAN